MQDLVTARFDYSQLDREESNVRVRLNSTVVNVANRGSEAVEVSYVRAVKPYRYVASTAYWPVTTA